MASLGKAGEEAMINYRAEVEAKMFATETQETNRSFSSAYQKV